MGVPAEQKLDVNEGCAGYSGHPWRKAGRLCTMEQAVLPKKGCEIPLQSTRCMLRRRGFPRASFHKEELSFVQRGLIEGKPRVCFRLIALQEPVLPWINPLTTSLALAPFADLTRGKAELLAANVGATSPAHFASTDQTTSFPENRPSVPGFSRQHGSDLETDALDRPAGDGSRGFHPGLFRTFWKTR
jgi:hypothetical protein